MCVLDGIIFCNTAHAALDSQTPIAGFKEAALQKRKRERGREGKSGEWKEGKGETPFPEINLWLRSWWPGYTVEVRK